MPITTLLSVASMFASESDNWRVKHPAWIWCDDFETGRSVSYFEHDTAGGKLTRAAGVGLHGSTGLKVAFSTGTVNRGICASPSATRLPATSGISPRGVTARIRCLRFDLPPLAPVRLLSYSLQNIFL